MRFVNGFSMICIGGRHLFCLDAGVPIVPASGLPKRLFRESISLERSLIGGANSCTHLWDDGSLQHHSPVLSPGSWAVDHRWARRIKLTLQRSVNIHSTDRAISQQMDRD